MKIFLQNREQNRYVAKEGAWTENPEAALVFGDLGQARGYVRSHGLSSIWLVGLAGGETDEVPSTAPELDQNCCRSLMAKPARDRSAG